MELVGLAGCRRTGGAGHCGARRSGARGTAEIESGAGELLAAIDKQNTLIAVGLVIAGFAVLLGAFAPRSGPAFAPWAGLATAAMGIMLAIFKSVVGRRRTCREPS